MLYDDSPMPYGQHKGKRMDDVPAKDLLWLLDNDRCSAEVEAYIRDNLDVLMKQAGYKVNTNDTDGTRRYRSRR